MAFHESLVCLNQRNERWNKPQNQNRSNLSTIVWTTAYSGRQSQISKPNENEKTITYQGSIPASFSIL